MFYCLMGMPSEYIDFLGTDSGEPLLSLQISDNRRDVLLRLPAQGRPGPAQGLHHSLQSEAGGDPHQLVL